MKIEDLKKMIPVDRESDKDGVVFKALCPFKLCSHEDVAFIHYGDEQEARDAAMRKVMQHIARDHFVDIEVEKPA